jgi:hypothetical protein
MHDLEPSTAHIILKLLPRAQIMCAVIFIKKSTKTNASEQGRDQSKRDHYYFFGTVPTKKLRNGNPGAKEKLERIGFGTDKENTSFQVRLASPGPVLAPGDL